MPSFFNKHRYRSLGFNPTFRASNAAFTPSPIAMTARRGINLGRLGRVLCIIALLGLMLFIGYKCMTAAPVKITLNDVRVRLQENSTVAMAITEANMPTTPGRLLAVDGSVLQDDGGTPFTVQVNGTPAKPNTILHNRDEIIVTPGKDITEPSHEKATYNIFDASSDGTWGAIHEVIGADPAGAGVAIVGEISGVAVEKEPPPYEQSGTLTMFDVVTSEKVIALTFDDGPWQETTGEILDILKENNAKASFFVLGQNIDESPEMAALVKRAFDEGHQVSTHTYSHAKDGEGFDLGLMPHEARVEDVTKGMGAIQKATGASPNRMMRAPGGNFNANTAASVSPYITYDVGWNIDSLDWQQPGADVIEKNILKAKSGDIILLHDGGGDRSQTAEALRNALPKLKEKGYSFVTVEQLLTYNIQTPQGELTFAESTAALESTNAGSY